MISNLWARIVNKVLGTRFRTKTEYYKPFKGDSFVLMFHEIEKNPTTDKFSTSIKKFVSIIDEINEKFGFIEPSSLFTNKGALLTFDDGYSDIFTIVFPLLKQRNIPFLVFLTTDFIGSKGYLTWEQISELNADPLCYFGAHTMSHPKLRFSKNSNIEILNSISIIQDKLKEKIKYFAYPYGTFFACSRKNQNEVKNSGVEYAFSAIPGYLNSYAQKNKYFLPRFDGANLDMNKFTLGEKL